MPRGMRSGETRDRLLLAAAELMDEAGGTDVSTRAICQRAAVEAPTLYHHFGSKQGLIDAVIQHGFTQYLAPPPTARDASLDPIEAIRLGWDRHVQFGLENPRFYALLYGNVERGKACAITAPALAQLTELLAAAARVGHLRVGPTDAAAQLLAANVGVTLSLIAQPEGSTDLGLSERVREAALAGVLAPVETANRNAAPTSAAVALAATLDETAVLTPGERALLKELLNRLANSGHESVGQVVTAIEENRPDRDRQSRRRRVDGRRLQG